MRNGLWSTVYYQYKYNFSALEGNCEKYGVTSELLDAVNAELVKPARRKNTWRDLLYGSM